MADQEQRKLPREIRFFEHYLGLGVLALAIALVGLLATRDSSRRIDQLTAQVLAYQAQNQLLQEELDVLDKEQQDTSHTTDQLSATEVLMLETLTVMAGDLAARSTEPPAKPEPKPRVPKYHKPRSEETPMDEIQQITDTEPEQESPAIEAPDPGTIRLVPWTHGHLRNENSASKCRHQFVTTTVPMHLQPIRLAIAAPDGKTEGTALALGAPMLGLECRNRQLIQVALQSPSLRTPQGLPPLPPEAIPQLTAMATNLQMCRFCPAWSARDPKIGNAALVPPEQLAAMQAATAAANNANTVQE